MKKLFVRLVVLVVVGAALLVGAGVFLFGPTSKATVERGASYALGVETRLGKVDAGLGLDRSHLGLVDLEVQNPEGFDGDPFLAIGELSLDLATMSVLSEAIQVPSIVLDGLHLRLVQTGKRSNFGEILEHVRSLGAGASPAGSSETAHGPTGEADAAGPSLLVDTIDLRGIKFSIDVSGIPGVQVTETYSAPDLHIDVSKTLDKARGMTVASLTGLIVDELVKHGVKEAGGHVSPQVMQLLTGGLAGLEEQLEAQVGEKVDELRGKAEEQLDTEKDKARAKLNELINEQDTKVQGKLKNVLGGGGG